MNFGGVADLTMTRRQRSTGCALYALALMVIVIAARAAESLWRMETSLVLASVAVAGLQVAGRLVTSWGGDYDSSQTNRTRYARGAHTGDEREQSRPGQSAPAAQRTAWPTNTGNSSGENRFFFGRKPGSLDGTAAGDRQTTSMRNR